MRRLVLLASLVVLQSSFAAPPGPAPAPDDAKQKQDLTAVIALHGKPCGTVTSYTAQGDNDFVATCSDGHRYHVHVKDGRVVVDAQ
jgi:hypothetical protein